MLNPAKLYDIQDILKQLKRQKLFYKNIQNYKDKHLFLN